MQEHQRIERVRIRCNSCMGLHPHTFYYEPLYALDKFNLLVIDEIARDGWETTTEGAGGHYCPDCIKEKKEKNCKGNCPQTF